MKYTLSALSLVLLTACASSPVDLATAPHVPPERILAPEYFKAGEGKVPVTVSFDPVATLRLYSTYVFVDGVNVIDILPGEKSEFYVQEGRRVLGFSTGIGGSFSGRVSDYFVPGETYKFRIHVGNNMEFIPD